MPVTRIKVIFRGVYVNNSADWFGPGEWHFTAKVNGKPVGDPNVEWEARTGQWIMLPEKKWSAEVDLLGKKPGDKVEVTFSGKDVDLISDDDLGEAKLTLKYPFQTERDAPIWSPVIKGWLFFPDHQYFAVQIKVKILEVRATQSASKSTGIVVSRASDGSSTFSTVSGNPVMPRVEVCPVVPVTVSPSALPPRPAFDASLLPGKATSWASPAAPQPTSALNALANPSFIPVLAKSDPDLQKKAARIALTWYWPGDLDVSMLSWHVKDGTVEIVGSNRGDSVLVRGTTAGSDSLATLEARWDGEKGPLLATYRAWTGPIKEVPYRINIVNGVDPTGHPGRSPQLSPADVHAHIQIARVIWWQAGISLVPDPDKTLWDGATATAHDGIFTLKAKKDTWTNNVDNNVNPIATRLNFNPGVINIAYVTNTKQGNAAATDIHGVTGKSVKLDGSPSTSWSLPSGVLPDKAAVALTMKAFPLYPRVNSSDAAYVKERQKVQPGFKSSDFKRLFALVYPSDWGTALGDNKHPQWAQNLAHELGHVLGLLHRGSGGHIGVDKGVLSDDGIDCADAKKKKRGHPWLENVMGYDNDRGLDVDIIQLPVVRRHPAAKAVP